MGAVTHIAWTDHTFNPWEGCTKVSPGCLHCYAETRNQRFTGGANWGKGKPRRRTSVHNWNEPLRWNRDYERAVIRRDEAMEVAPPGSILPPYVERPRVFCASLADWLDDEVEIEWLADLLHLVFRTPNLDWQLLTKRPENFFPRVQDILSDVRGLGRLIGEGDKKTPFGEWLAAWYHGAPPDNVWVGVSVEDQTRADLRIPLLLNIPAKIRFLSMEPLLDAVNLRGNGYGPDWLEGWDVHQTQPHGDPEQHQTEKIDWVIIGGESGHDARPFDLQWARAIIDQCKKCGVPVFMKQVGALAIGASNNGARFITEHTKGGDPAEWPVELRVQEFPNKS